MSIVRDGITGTGPLVSFSPSALSAVGSGFSLPSGVAVDSAGDVFVADWGHGAVKEIVAVNGVVSSSSTVNTVGSTFSSPMGVAADSAGEVFVADKGHNVVKESPATNLVPPGIRATFGRDRSVMHDWFRFGATIPRAVGSSE